MKSESKRFSRWAKAVQSRPESSSVIELGLYLWQEYLLNRPERFIILYAGRQSGKTEVMIKKVILDLLKHKNRGKAWITARTYRQAKEVLWDRIQWALNEFPEGVVVGKNDAELKIDLIGDKSLYLKGLDKIEPDDVRGSNLLVLGMTEAAFCSGQHWEKILTPMLGRNMAKVFIESSPNGMNWMYYLARKGGHPGIDGKVIEAELDPDYFFARVPTPGAGPITDEEVERWRQEMDPDTYRQEVLAEVLTYAGLLVPEFYARTHAEGGNILPVDEWEKIKKEQGGNLLYVRGLDWGIAAHTVCLWAAVDPVGRVIVYREFAATGRSVRDLAFEIKQRSHEEIIMTPADPNLWKREGFDMNMISQHFGSYGVPLVKSDNDFDPSIVKFRQMCQAENIQNDPLSPMPRFMIVQGAAPMLSNQLKRTEAQYPDRKGSAITGKQPMDAIDAARYILMKNVRGVRMVKEEDPNRPWTPPPPRWGKEHFRGGSRYGKIHGLPVG